MIIYQGRETKDQPKFRPDQSKFEYEKNQLSVDDVDINQTSAWKSSWDKYDEHVFFSNILNLRKDFSSSLKKESASARHLYLIRHGQYFDNSRTLSEMKLTILGKEQLVYTGRRLNQMNIRFDRLIHSGMVRAVESAEIINEQLDSKLQLIEDKNLTEGLPVAPVPYAGISQRDVDVREEETHFLI